MTALHTARTRLALPETTEATHGAPTPLVRPVVVMAAHTVRIHLALPETIRAIHGALTLLVPLAAVTVPHAAQILSVPCVVNKYAVLRGAQTVCRCGQL